LAKKSRGRPLGSSPNKEADEQILRKAGMLMLRGRARNPTEAFRDTLGDPDDHLIRRLQRRWLRERDRILAELQAPLWDQRWEWEAAALEKSAPDVFAKIKVFAESEGGAAVLAEMRSGRSQRQMMALGIMRLWELVEEHSPVGMVAADRAFARLLAGWSRFGTEPTAPFLRRIAERCLERAGEIEGTEGSAHTSESAGGASS
jgi:hypothetical protein